MSGTAGKKFIGQRNHTDPTSDSRRAREKLKHLQTWTWTQKACSANQSKQSQVHLIHLKLRYSHSLMAQLPSAQTQAPWHRLPSHEHMEQTRRHLWTLGSLQKRTWISLAQSRQLASLSPWLHNPKGRSRSRPPFLQDPLLANGQGNRFCPSGQARHRKFNPNRSSTTNISKLSVKTTYSKTLTHSSRLLPRHPWRSEES